MTRTPSDLIFRREAESDRRAVEELTRDAFWDVFKPGCDEHYLLHIFRGHPDFIDELNTVAVRDGEIVGHIAYSRAAIVQPDGTRFPLVMFGPLSVRPGVQKTGVGSALLRYTLARARGLGFAAVAVCGHPDYYPRFGFRPARAFGITDQEGQSPDYLMALELREGALENVSGVLAESPVFFSLSPEEVDAFAATFPPREKHVLDTQLV